MQELIMLQFQLMLWVSVVSCTVKTLKELKQILISQYKLHYIHYLI